ncbi:MAG TPA: sulfatase-like hydrolase/transferase [Actinomycetes bacterium]|nr:sulfatase-like hydrolase/transferase [Actinomycetes bacterium]
MASEIDEAGTAPAGAAPEEAGDGRRRWRDRLHLWALVELFVLSGFAIAQPLLDVTSNSPDFFLFRRADRLDIIALVLGVIGFPAVFIWGFEVAVGLVSETVRRVLHLAAVGGLATVLAIQVVKKLTDLRGPVVVAAALAAGVLVGALYARTSWLKLWLRYLAPAPLVFALVFLLLSPVSKLVLPARAEATAAAAPATVTSGKQPPVVVIFFDEFPLKSLLDSKGQIDRRVYPNFARLADQSTWYRNATGVSGFTPWAMPAMLTGRYPAKVKAPSYTEYPDNMLTLFGKYYDLKAYETISQLCPPSKCRSTAGNLDRIGLKALVGDSARVLSEIVSPYDTAVDPATFIDQTAAEESAPKDGKPLDPQFRFNQLRLNQPSRFNDFLAGLKASDRPTMHFLHILLPHAPWRYLPSGNEYNYKTFGRAFKSDQTPAPIVELAHERHLLQLAYTDRLVGQVIDKLKAEGMWDKSLVAMGADHGEGWVPGEKPRSLGKTNASDLMWVPQFIKAPGQDSGVVDDRNWEQVDLLPTIADLAGIQVPWKMEGVSQTGRPTRTRTDKWWYDIPGHRQTRPGPPNWAQVLKGSTDSLVRASEGDKGLYRFGGFADLVYREATSVGPVTAGQEATAEQDDFKQYGQIKLKSGRIPALVSGKLTSPLPPAGSTVLVAVNGRIGGESKLFPERPGEPAAKFAVITPDTLWQAGDGHRQLQVYIVDRSGGGPRLIPVSLSAG